MSRKNKAQKLLRERSPILYWLVTIAGIVLFTFFMVVLNYVLTCLYPMPRCQEIMNKQRGWQTRIMQKVISDINQAASIQYETDIPYKKDISEEDFILSNDYSSGDCYIDEEYTLISDKPWRSRAGGFIEYKMSEHEYNINITKIKKYFSKMGVNIEYNQVLDIYYFKTVHFDDKNEIKNSAIVLSSIRYDNNKMILSIKFKGEEK